MKNSRKRASGNHLAITIDPDLLRDSPLYSGFTSGERDTCYGHMLTANEQSYGRIVGHTEVILVPAYRD